MAQLLDTTVTGNIITSQNTSSGNLAITQNLSTGNSTTTQNTTSGNLIITQNTSSGNLSTTQNSTSGNSTVTQNISSGNVYVTQNTTSGNLIIQSPSGNSVILINASPYSPTSIAGANQVSIFVRNIANICMVATDSNRANNSNFDTSRVMGVSPANKMIGTVRPQLGTTNTTCFTSHGLTLNCVALTSYCNTSNGIPTNTSPIFKNSNRRFQLGANANLTTGNATIFCNVNTAWMGGTTGTAVSNGGGFIYSVRFSHDILASNVRTVVGMTNAIISIVNGTVDYDPFINTVHHIIAVAGNTNSGNMWMLIGANGTARTATDLGVNFNFNTNDVYDLIINVPAGGGSVGWAIRNLTNGAQTGGMTSVNIPAANVFMQPHVCIKSNTAAISNTSIMNMYIETDY